MHAHSDGFINLEKMDEGGRLNENKQYCKNRFMNGDLAKQDGRGAVAELSNALLSFLISMKQTEIDSDMQNRNVEPVKQRRAALESRQHSIQDDSRQRRRNSP